MALQSVCSQCPKLGIAVIFVRTQKLVSSAGSIVGLLALQASVIPLTIALLLHSNLTLAFALLADL